MKTKFNVKSALHKTFKKKENLKLKKTNIHINNHSMMGPRNFKPMNYYQKFESDINNPNGADKLNHLQSTFKFKIILKNEKFLLNIYIYEYKSSTFERKQQNINKTELDSEIFEEIKILWQELGIKYEYQNEFESYLINIENPEKRMKYLTFEKNNLTELKNSLIKFRKEKQLRTRNIKLLKELNSGIYISLTKEKKIQTKKNRKQYYKLLHIYLFHGKFYQSGNIILFKMILLKLNFTLLVIIITIVKVPKQAA